MWTVEFFQASIQYRSIFRTFHQGLTGIIHGCNIENSPFPRCFTGEDCCHGHISWRSASLSHVSTVDPWGPNLARHAGANAVGEIVGWMISEVFQVRRKKGGIIATIWILVWSFLVDFGVDFLGGEDNEQTFHPNFHLWRIHQSDLIVPNHSLGRRDKNIPKCITSKKYAFRIQPDGWSATLTEIMESLANEDSEFVL